MVTAYDPSGRLRAVALQWQPLRSHSHTGRRSRSRVLCVGTGRTHARHPSRRERHVTNTHVAWSTSRGSPFVPSPLVYGDYLYTINDMASIVTCFEAATGTVMWQERLGRPTREGFSASPVVVDGKVFFTNDEGQTFVLKAGPEFELLHTNDIGARTLASPALVDRRWYVRTERELVAIAD